MEIREVSIDKVVPYWNNPRTNEATVEHLVCSIKEFGFNQPIVVDKNMVVIVGHARLKAAKKLGLKTVPCNVVDLDEKKAKKYRIADNKIAELSEWKDEELYKELREIADKVDLLEMGFSTEEINDIVGEAEELAETIEEEYEVATADAVPVGAVPFQPRAEEAPKPSFIDERQKDKEQIEEELKKREAELNGRFVKESFEDTRFQNIVVCPHCGQTFKVKGLK